jgi:photosystem II stability/assembly factor-like uncharacterized protein
MRVTIPQRGTMRHGAAPTGISQHMQLVASTSSPFRSVGRGPQIPNLKCVTTSVCYVWGIGPGGSGMERTPDGGATWQTLAALPGHRSLVQDNSWSCPTAQTCIAVAGSRQLAVTTDGGDHWSIKTVPAPAGSSGATIDQASCPTAQDCVVHLYDHGPGTFLSTVNGGRTWTAASAIPRGSPRYLWQLRCDQDGRCIGLYPAGTAADDELSVTRSTDNGRTWTSYSVHLPPTAILQMDCGDALHCMAVTFDKGIQMTTTSDGGLAWQLTAAPRSWPSIATSVSCATGLDCFIAVSRYSSTVVTPTGRGGYGRAVVEATYNGGRAWTTISLPADRGSPLAVVNALSCPIPGGCMAVAATPRQEDGAGEQVEQRDLISSLPAPGQPVAGG